MKEKTKKILKVIVLCVMILAFTAFVVGAVITLATPNARIVGDTLYITPSADAEGYRVYVDGTLQATIANNIYSVTGSITNGSLYGSNLEIQGGASLTVQIVPDSNYVYPSTVTASNCTYSYNALNGVVTLSNAVGNVVITATCLHAPYTITGVLTNLVEDSNNSDFVISQGETAHYYFSASQGYNIPSSISVTNASYVYNQLSSTSGEVVLTNPTGNVTITASGVLAPVTYAFSFSITNGTITSVKVNNVSNGTTVPSSVSPTDSVEINFTANSGYELPTTVTVDGSTVTENAGTGTHGDCASDYGTYNGTGTIYCDTFTGAVSVSATCPQSSPSSYTIPAGTYYGKSTIASFNTVISIPFTVTYGSYTYNMTSIFCEVNEFNFKEYLYYNGDFKDSAYGFDNDSWNAYYRTITVTQNTTVTQDEYNAFFACFDYAFYLAGTQRKYFIYEDGMTWIDFCNSSTYNPISEFSYTTNTRGIAPQPSGVFYELTQIKYYPSGINVSPEDYISNNINGYAISGGGN